MYVTVLPYLSTSRAIAIYFFLYMFVTGTCRGIEAPVNGVEVGTFKYFYKSGEKAEFACLSGYTLVGTDTLYCQNGTFNSSVPTCHGKQYLSVIVPLYQTYCSKCTFKLSRICAQENRLLSVYS